MPTLYRTLFEQWAEEENDRMRLKMPGERRSSEGFERGVTGSHLHQKGTLWWCLHIASPSVPNKRTQWSLGVLREGDRGVFLLGWGPAEQQKHLDPPQWCHFSAAPWEIYWENVLNPRRLMLLYQKQLIYPQYSYNSKTCILTVNIWKCLQCPQNGFSDNVNYLDKLDNIFICGSLLFEDRQQDTVQKITE